MLVSDQNLLDSLVDAAIVADSAGIIVQVNKTTSELLGYNQEELIGKPVEILVPEHLRSMHERHRRSFTAKSEHEPVLLRRDLQALTKSGENLPVEITVSPLKGSDARMFLVQARSISERVRMEKKISEYTSELSRSNRELSEFASVAAHDLKEPLRKIVSFSGRLEQRVAQDIDETSADYLSRIVNASVRMQTLIEDLLALSRVNSRERKFERIELQNLLEKVLEDLDGQISETGAKIEIETLPEINADSLQMAQVFNNLISNSLKYRSEQRAPELKIKSWSHIDRSPLDGHEVEYASIEVSDNGMGFEQQYAERIFGVFQRLHGRGVYEGNGIGLALCRRIVQRHGGSISAESIPDEGSTFRVTVPIEGPMI